MENNILKDSKTKSDIILAMETGVNGGSVSLFADKKIIDFFIGNKSISGAEDLLPKINELLIKNKIPKSDVDVIIVSNGPGSFTGIRIGIATALALKKTLKCRCAGIDLLNAMAQTENFQTKSEKVLSAVSYGRNRICWFGFDKKNLNANFLKNEYFVSDTNNLINYISEYLKYNKDEQMMSVCVDSKIYAFFEEKKVFTNNDSINLINFGENLSSALISGYFNKGENIEKPEPLYLSEKNFISQIS